MTHTMDEWWVIILQASMHRLYVQWSYNVHAWIHTVQLDELAVEDSYCRLILITQYPVSLTEPDTSLERRKGVFTHGIAVKRSHSMRLQESSPAVLH